MPGEEIGARELEGNQQVPGGAAVRSGGAQTAEGGRSEQAAPAAEGRPGGVDRVPRKRIIADRAPVPLQGLESAPAGLADAAAEDPLDRTIPARQAPGRKKEVRGGAQQGVQIPLRESPAASVTIGDGFYAVARRAGPGFESVARGPPEAGAWKLEPGTVDCGLEVLVSLVKKLALVTLALAVPAGRALAQGWRAGATIGVVNDVENNFAWENFKSKDVNGSIEFEVQDRVIVRATYGEMRVKGDNGGKTVTPPGSSAPTTLPDLTDDISYATLGVSYEFWEGAFMSGLFGGFGGYKVKPREAPPEFASYRDTAETVLGLHIGADAGFEIVKRLSLMVRLTYHAMRTTGNRSILTANTGLTYKF
jgi:hypothetical protein